MEDEKAKNPRLLDEVAWEIVLIRDQYMQKYHNDKFADHQWD